MKREFIITILCFVIILFGGLFAQEARAATRTVDTVFDHGGLWACTAAPDDCSLRGAVEGAAAGDTINFASGINFLELGNHIYITKSITITGPGANLLTIDGGSGSNRIFTVDTDGGMVTISGLTMTGGDGGSSPGCGGGIRCGGAIFAKTPLTLDGIAVSFNSAHNPGINSGIGGGIYALRALRVFNSTINNNFAGFHAGGISGGTENLEVFNSTISNNSAYLIGGIKGNLGYLVNVTVTGNTNNYNPGGVGSGVEGSLYVVMSIIAQNGGDTQAAGIQNGGYNIIGGDARLNPLADNGGSTRTHSLQCNSPALNTSDPNNANNLPTDQRGIARPQAGRSDIGAFERSGVDILTSAVLPQAHLNSTYSQMMGCSAFSSVFTLTSGSLPNGLTLAANGSLSGTPTESGTFNFRITATDNGASNFKDFTLVVLAFSPATLPGAVLNHGYSQQFTLPGATSAYTYSLQSGTLPAGITLSPSGVISGTPTQAGYFPFRLRATNNTDGSIIEANYTLATGNGFVSNVNSSGAGSLRQVINDPPAGGTIVFDPNFFNQPRTIVDRFEIFKNLTIIGPGSGLLTIDGANGGRVLNIDGGVTLNLSGVRITRGYNDHCGGAIMNNGGSTLNAARIIIDNSHSDHGGGGICNVGTLNLTDSFITGNTSVNEGGGIRNAPNFTVNITNSTVSNNQATNWNGGGVSNYGALNVFGSTLSGNSAPNGGGVYAGGISIINNSTLSDNTASGGVGGAVYISSGSRLDTTNTTITGNVSNSNQIGGIFNQGLYQTRNSIIAGNRNLSGAGNGDLNGDIASYGWNLFGNTSGTNIGSTGTGGQTLTGNLYNVAANLAPLGNYGGATETHAPLSNSPAINAASDSFTTDQRGSERKIGAAVDIGAFERNITFDQSALPNAYTSAAYSQQLSATRLTSFAENEFVTETQSFAPTTFEIVPVAGQSLPPGITLSPTGMLSGAPTGSGTFSFTVKATDTDGMAGVQQFTIQVFAPTSAEVSISGRILMPDGTGLRDALVTLTDSQGYLRTRVSTTFGHYRFDDVEVGQVYILSVSSRRYHFSSQVVLILEEINEMNLTALE